jgi:hypothetical protein
MREQGAFVEGAIACGHSVGEYTAVACVTGVFELEALIEVVFHRGSKMHDIVPRDEQGRSNYRLAAIRPSQIDIHDADVKTFVAEIAERTGEFLQIVNFNLRGAQYAIAGTVRGLEALEEEVERRREITGGKRAYILVPGIDVPFHSDVLRIGVDEFRRWLRRVATGLGLLSVVLVATVFLLAPHLVPRVLARARAGRLRIVGDGLNQVDMVHVENATDAHLLAEQALATCNLLGYKTDPAGRAYFITNGEPVRLWDWINALLTALGEPPVTRRVSLRTASALGAVCESLWHALPLRGEPPMTRFIAAELAKDHWFNLSAARRDLGYSPRITMAAGTAALVASLHTAKP